MSEWIAPWDFSKMVVEPWTVDLALTLPIVLMGFFVTAACGLVGNYLLLRRMALVGDAISHSLLFGLVVTFLIVQQISTLPMFLGAVVTGVLTVVLIEWIHSQSRVKPDAAICIVFTVLFALGVVILSVIETKGTIHLDPDCILYGEIALIPLESAFYVGEWNLGPFPVVRMGLVFIAVVIAIGVFYKELLVTSFDASLAQSLGIKRGVWHYGLMVALSIVIVSAFEAVGAILAIAMLIVPPMFAAQLSDRLQMRLLLTVLNAFLSSVIGYHFSVWLQCSVAGAMVVISAVLFLFAWGMVFFRAKKPVLEME